jgi:hypothetical protein
LPHRILHATLASTYLLNAVAYRRTYLLLVTAARVRRIIKRAQRHLCFNKSVFLGSRDRGGGFGVTIGGAVVVCRRGGKLLPLCYLAERHLAERRWRKSPLYPLHRTRRSCHCTVSGGGDLATVTPQEALATVGGALLGITVINIDCWRRLPRDLLLMM